MQVTKDEIENKSPQWTCPQQLLVVLQQQQTKTTKDNNNNNNKQQKTTTNEPRSVSLQPTFDVEHFTQSSSQVLTAWDHVVCIHIIRPNMQVDQLLHQGLHGICAQQINGHHTKGKERKGQDRTGQERKENAIKNWHLRKAKQNIDKTCIGIGIGIGIGFSLLLVLLLLFVVCCLFVVYCAAAVSIRDRQHLLRRQARTHQHCR